MLYIDSDKTTYYIVFFTKWIAAQKHFINTAASTKRSCYLLLVETGEMLHVCGVLDNIETFRHSGER